MDTPVCFRNRSLYVKEKSDEDFDNIEELMEYALERDDKEEFINLSKEKFPTDDDNKGRELISWTMSRIFGYDSANIAAELIAVNGGISNFAHSYSKKECVLHHAAACANPRLTALFLEHGLSADLRSDVTWFAAVRKWPNLKQAFPLTAALLCWRLYWWEFSSNRRVSAVQVLITLCCYRKRDRMETVRLLAQNMTTKQLKREFYNYLRDGKMIEVGSLLMTASNRLISPSNAAEGEDDASMGFASITEMRRFLFSEILSCASGTRSMPDNAAGDDTGITQLKEMEQTLQLLEIFDRVGDKLVAYIWTPRMFVTADVIEIASLIQDVGFDVKIEDSVYCKDRRFRHGGPAFRSKIMQRGLVDECKKKASAIDLLPWWMKEASIYLSGNSSRLAHHPLLKKTELKMGTSSYSTSSTYRNGASRVPNDPKFFKRFYPLINPLKRAARHVK